LATFGQLSLQSAMPSPSLSVSGVPQPQVPGAILLGSFGQPSMSPSELRQSFDALQRLLTQSEQTGEEKSAQPTVTQVDAIRREMTWIKERLYP
jgi:hypothetical protein